MEFRGAGGLAREVEFVAERAAEFADQHLRADVGEFGNVFVHKVGEGVEKIGVVLDGLSYARTPDFDNHRRAVHEFGPVNLANRARGDGDGGKIPEHGVQGPAQGFFQNRDDFPAGDGGDAIPHPAERDLKLRGNQVGAGGENLPELHIYRPQLLEGGGEPVRDVHFRPVMGVADVLDQPADPGEVFGDAHPFEKMRKAVSRQHGEHLAEPADVDVCSAHVPDVHARSFQTLFPSVLWYGERGGRARLFPPHRASGSMIEPLHSSSIVNKASGSPSRSALPPSQSFPASMMRRSMPDRASVRDFRVPA